MILIGFSISNIQADYRSAGICSLHEIIFREADFLPYKITERLQNESSQIFEQKMEVAVGANDETINSVSLQRVQTISKAPLQKTNNCGLKPQKPTVPTDKIMRLFRGKQKATADIKAKQIAALISRITERKAAKEALKKAKDATTEGSRKVTLNKNKISDSSSVIKNCTGNSSEKQSVYIVSSDDSDTCHE